MGKQLLDQSTEEPGCPAGTNRFKKRMDKMYCALAAGAAVAPSRIRRKHIEEVEQAVLRFQHPDLCLATLAGHRVALLPSFLLLLLLLLPLLLLLLPLGLLLPPRALACGRRRSGALPDGTRDRQHPCVVHLRR